MERNETGNGLSVTMDEMRMQTLFRDSLIRATDTYKTPPQVIWVDGSAIATLGNFSASTGKAKSRKTFNVSAIVAACLAGTTVLNYRACLPEGKKRILYVDTEQSRYHCHNVLERILLLAGMPSGIDNDNLDFLCLREYTPSMRLSLVDFALRRRNGYGLVIIDGIRDMMLDINNAGESVEIINKLMQWSGKYDLHIHCVLHLNKGDDNVRGHIGTELNNKAETVLVISKNSQHPAVSEVRPMHIRDKDFAPFAFSIDDRGVPIMATGYEQEEKRNSRMKFSEIPMEQHRQALSAAFAGKPIRGFENMVKVLGEAYASIGFERGRSVIIKLLYFLMDEKHLISKRDKLFYCGTPDDTAQLFDNDDP